MADTDSAEQTQAKSDWLRRLGSFAEVFALFTALMYGLSWLFYASFYDRLGVNPEDIGISVNYYLVRIAFLSFGIGVLLAFAYLLGARSGYLALLVDGNHDPVHRIFRIVFLSLFLGSYTTIAIAFFVSKPWRNGISVADFIPLAFGLAVATAAAIFVLWLSGYRRADGKLKSPDTSKTALITATFMATTVVLMIAVYQGGRRAADYVIDGNTIESPLLRVTEVRVLPLSSTWETSQGAQPSTCLLELGTNHSIVVFIDPTTEPFQVVQLPIEGVRILTSACGDAP